RHARGLRGRRKPDRAGVPVARRSLAWTLARGRDRHLRRAAADAARGHAAGTADRRRCRQEPRPCHPARDRARRRRDRDRRRAAQGVRLRRHRERHRAHQRGADHHQVAIVQVDRLFLNTRCTSARPANPSRLQRGSPMPAKKTAGKKKSAARKPASKMPPSRVPILAEDQLSPIQRALLDSIRSGPRGGGTTIRGPFAVFLHAPAFGELAQQLGGYCRFKTAVPPRLSEFAILVTAKLWQAQYEWFAHVPMAERAGVSKETIRDLYRRRLPKSAPKDERPIYAFIQEL